MAISPTDKSMTVQYHPAPDQFRGKGTVYLAWDEDRQTYWGYWELEPDGNPTPLEPCPQSPAEEDVLSWALARTHRVAVRPRWDPQITYYWSSNLAPPPNVAEWPKLPLTRERGMP